MRQKLAFALESIQSFFRHEASSGILLLFFAALAMALANSAWAESYETALAMKPIAGPAEYHLDLSVLHWVNDGLMAIFFFVIGLEIKREFFFGELQSLSATMLPICTVSEEAPTLMMSLFRIFASRSKISPSRKACSFFASSYSEFSDRSPSAIAALRRSDTSMRRTLFKWSSFSCSFL